MAFTGTNVGQSMQPQLSNYLGASNHLHRGGSSGSTSSYPLLHPAAMAAVAAAAAAGYSQQFGTRVGSAPLNLTSTPGTIGNYAFQPTDMSRSNYYYSNLALQQHSTVYPGGYQMNGFTPYKPQPQFSGARSAFLNPSPNCSANAVVSTSQTELNGTVAPSSKGSGVKSSGPKPKKSIKAEEVAMRKRQEFEELVKARTDKLLSDGPVYTPNGATAPLSSSSSIGSTGLGPTETSGSNYTKLIQAVLDAKKAALLRSPEVVAHLQRQQRALAEHKRQTELFGTDMRK